MGDVVRFNGITKLDLPAEQILDAARERGLQGVVLCGYTEDGTEYFASSYADGGDVLWLLRRCEHRLMGVTDGLAE